MLSRNDLEILRFLEENGGYDTGCVARGISSSGNKRKHSALTRQSLLWLKKEGYVEFLDNGKPVLWKRTAKGTKALAEAA